MVEYELRPRTQIQSVVSDHSKDMVFDIGPRETMVTQDVGQSIRIISCKDKSSRVFTAPPYSMSSMNMQFNLSYVKNDLVFYWFHRRTPRINQSGRSTNRKTGSALSVGHQRRGQMEFLYTPSASKIPLENELLQSLCRSPRKCLLCLCCGPWKCPHCRPGDRNPKRR